MQYCQRDSEGEPFETIPGTQVCVLLTLNEGPLVFALNSDQVGHTSFTLSLREVEGGRGSRLQVAVVPVF